MSSGEPKKPKNLAGVGDGSCVSQPGAEVEDCAEWFETVDLEKEVSRIEIMIPGRVEAVGPAVERIMAQVKQVGCIEGNEFEVEVALLEAIANAVEHGCRGDSSKEVSVSAACAEECGLLVVIRDPGDGFDPGELPSPVEGENLFRTHGRGVWLINRLMDAVRYDKRGTELRMHKKPNKKK